MERARKKNIAGVGHGGSKIKHARKDGIAGRDGGSKCQNACFRTAATASASASCSGGIGEPDRSTSVGMGRSKWES